MARAFGVTHKCLLPVAGKTMIARVVESLTQSRRFSRIFVSIEDEALLGAAFADSPNKPVYVQAQESAAASAHHALSAAPFRPTMVTTADHPLLTSEIIEYFLNQSNKSDADLLVGLAPASVIQQAYPHTRRTYLKFANDRVSGCNLFALRTPDAVSAAEHWRSVEKNRKKPWRMVWSFGPIPLVRYFLGTLSLEGAFAAASKALHLEVRPVVLPFAEAAIDVDRPGDPELAEQILNARTATSPPPSVGPAANPPGSRLRTTGDH